MTDEQAFKPTAHPPVTRVCVESPLRGDIFRNLVYADACMLDCFQRGEAPFLGHRFYPFVLNDGDPMDRRRGIDAHLAWLAASQLVAVYIDLGITPGMVEAIRLARELGISAVERELGPGWMQRMAMLKPTEGFRV